MRRLSLLFVLLAATGLNGPLGASGASFSFEPLLPRPQDEVVLSVTYTTACFVRGETEREGRTVRVVAMEGCVCPEVVPSPLTFAVELGRLPPTVYDVELWLVRRDSSTSCGDDQLLDVTRLVVQTISTHAAITSEPAAPRDGDHVELHVDSYCPSEFRKVEVVGDVVFIEEVQSLIAAPCFPFWRSELDLGVLAAGRYSLQFLFDEGDAGAQAPPGPVPGPLELNTVDTLVVGDGGEPPASEVELFLESDRFRVTASFGNDGGLARAVELTPRSGYFWFYSSDNLELAVKILDGCAINDHYWFFAAGLTDVEVEIRVEDRIRRVTRSYHSGPGGFEEIRDVLAFSGCSVAAPAHTESQLSP